MVNAFSSTNPMLFQVN